MSNKAMPMIGVKVIKAAERPIEKAETTTQINENEAFNAGDWIEPPTDLRGYKALVENSTILPQCIRAYKNNIAGFGIGVRYKEDIQETPEMVAEFQKAEEIVELFSLEQDTKEIFEDIIEARETYGIAYLEVIRNIAGEVVQIEFINDTVSIRKTQPLEPYIDHTYYHNGNEVTRKKKYRKFKQQLGGRTVYFKEFGDPRIMDKRDGKYITENETLEIIYQANEIIEFAIGTKPYGEVRWIGQILGVDGSRKAERLNNNYFENGRHTPLMIVVKGGTLTDESFDKLQMYMNDIKGEAGQHAFLLLETEGADGRVDFDAKESPSIEIKDMANILQKDELFQEYMDNNRRKVQSAFQLPDLYVGYTTDFNRATALTAQEVTEEQVFQPERKSLAWVLNNKLLNSYQFKYVEIFFQEPNITNPDDIYKVLSVCSRAGGLTPNKAKEIIYNAYGQTSEDYEGDWGNIPLAAADSVSTEKEPEINIDQITLSLDKQIQKAARNHDDAIVAVMKEVKNLLQSRQNHDIIKEGWITTEEGNHVYMDGDGNFQGGSAGYQSYASSQGRETTPTHKIAEGKDITQSFKIDPDSPKSVFDQVCEAQGYNGRPQVAEYREFMEAAKECGTVCYRTWNDSYDGTTADEYKEQFAYQEDFEAKGSGGRLYGSGTYMTATPNPKEGKMPSSSAMRYARDESRGYGERDVRATATITFDKDAKIIERSSLIKLYEKESDSVREKADFDLGTYAAMKGYDGIRVKNAAYKTDYVAVCNRTKCIVFDDINEPDEDKRGF